MGRVCGTRGQGMGLEVGLEWRRGPWDQGAENTARGSPWDQGRDVKFTNSRPGHLQRLKFFIPRPCRAVVFYFLVNIEGNAGYFENNFESQGCISQQLLACRALKSPFKIHWVNEMT